MRKIPLSIATLVVCLPFCEAFPTDFTTGKFAFERKEDRVIIARGGIPVASYVFKDPRIPRPFFANVHTPGGLQVTRRHPPVAGQDPTDHDTMHPGIWLAFGDINGTDFWRNQGRVEHVRFTQEPSAIAGGTSFAVLNRYLTTDGTKELCREAVQFTFLSQTNGTVLLWESEIGSDQTDLVFTAQEEMGLGVRVASELRVEGGTGEIRNSQGGKNGAGTWGKESAWWDYSGVIDQRRAGILLVPSPLNTLKNWGHTRDYGLMVANPFPVPVTTPVRTVLRRGEKLTLRYAILLHEAPAAATLDLASLAAEALSLLKPR